MCMFCAAIPIAAATGAKLNADQKRDQAAGKIERPKPIAVITGGAVVLLLVGSMTYHTLTRS